MNKERILKLADNIEALEYVEDNKRREVCDASIESFSMSRYAYNCGAPACIAGWAASIWMKDAFEERDEYGDHTYSTFDLAKEALDIDNCTARLLFEPSCQSATVLDRTYLSEYYGDGGTSRHISPERAARQLRYLVEHEQVNWAATP